MATNCTATSAVVKKFPSCPLHSGAEGIFVQPHHRRLSGRIINGTTSNRQGHPSMRRSERKRCAVRTTTCCFSRGTLSSGKAGNVGPHRARANFDKG